MDPAAEKYVYQNVVTLPTYEIQAWTLFLSGLDAVRPESS